MKIDWQFLVVAFIFASALFYVVKVIYKSSKGDSCESGNCKCHPVKKEVTE